MFDHYIGIDWAQSNVAVARLTKKSKKAHVYEGPSDVEYLKAYFSELRGRISLTIEECTASQWLYTELKDSVEELIVCDPRRNRLLAEGPKTDKIDAIKLARLLRAGMLKAVFHSGDDFIYYRKIVSGYQDVIKAGVRVKNQRAALLRASGRSSKETENLNSSDKFVLDGLETSIEQYETERTRYVAEFERLTKKTKQLQNLKSLTGISDIGAIKVLSRVVDPRRFSTRGQFLSYCGLVKHERMSGGRSYGKKSTNYNRELKNVFITAAVVGISSGPENYIRRRYEYLMEEKGYPAHTARRAVSRHIATLAIGVLKSGKRFEPQRRGAADINK